MNVIFLYGPPAVGKLTTAQSISSKTGYKVLHNHLVLDMIYSVFGYEEPKFFDQMVHKELLNVFENAAKHDINVVMTYCYYDERDSKFMADLVNIIDKYKGNLYITRLFCTENELMRRVTGVSRLKYGKSHTPEKLKTILDEYDYYSVIPNIDHLNIDTTQKFPDQVADEILSFYKIEKSLDAEYPSTLNKVIQ